MSEKLFSQSICGPLIETVTQTHLEGNQVSHSHQSKSLLTDSGNKGKGGFLPLRWELLQEIQISVEKTETDMWSHFREITAGSC